MLSFESVCPAQFRCVPMYERVSGFRNSAQIYVSRSYAHAICGVKGYFVVKTPYLW